MMHLIWRITIPGMLPASMTYDKTSALHVPSDLSANSKITLTKFSNEEYIESTLVFKVVENVNMNNTLLECIITDLGKANKSIIVNKLGKYGYYACRRVRCKHAMKAFLEHIRHVFQTTHLFFFFG